MRSIVEWRETGQETRDHSQVKHQTTNKDPNYPHIRNWLFDHIYFNFYDGTRVYDNQDSVHGQSSRQPHHHEATMFNQVIDKVMSHLNTKFPGKYQRDHCSSLRYRTVPTVGLELDVICRTPDGETERVTLVKEFSVPRLAFHHDRPNTSITLIVPLQGRLHTLKVFLANLRVVLGQGLLQVGLTVVYFNDLDSQKVQQLLKATEDQTHNLKTEFIPLKEKFSRGLGLQEGVRKTRLEGQVMFFCDVDVLFSREFLTRCLNTPVRGYQVYMPTLFSLYNPRFVFPHSAAPPSALQLMQVRDHYGYWRIWGHGMVCIYKDDVLKMGPIPNGTSWGGEDLNPLEKKVR
nr:chondroitin sulfate N-acetylgalactosaminyltransferase 2-like [Cherax quadricarinatus]